MKLYKVKQYTKKVGLDLEEITKTISEHYYVNLKDARAEYYKMKVHYLSCKPERIKEDKHISGEFANFWDVEAFFRESATTYVTSISEIETM